MTPIQAARRLAVSSETLRRWGIEGRLSEIKTAGGHRRYRSDEVERLMPTAPARRPYGEGVTTVGYARVSSHGQKASGDLDRQAERLVAAGAETVYRDVASGLSESRTGLRGLLNRVEQGDIDRVVVVTRDRLARFGVKFIETHIESYGASLTVLDPEDRDASPESELVSDLLALVASFSGRLYGLRSARRREIEKLAAQVAADEVLDEQE